MKSTNKRMLSVITTLSVVCIMSATSLAASFSVYQTGAGHSDKMTQYFNFSGSKTSVYAYCSSATHNSTVTVVVPGSTTWTLAAGQGHTFSRTATSGMMTCSVTLNPSSSGAESAQGTIS